MKLSYFLCRALCASGNYPRSGEVTDRALAHAWHREKSVIRKAVLFAPCELHPSTGLDDATIANQLKARAGDLEYIPE